MVMVLDTWIRFYENLVKIRQAGLQNKVFFSEGEGEGHGHGP